MPIYRDEFEHKARQNAFKLASEKSKDVKEHEYSFLLELVVCYVNLQVQ